MDFSYQFKELGKVSIPTMKGEVFELLKPTNLIINIELKTGIFEIFSYEGIEEKNHCFAHAEDLKIVVVYFDLFHHEDSRT